MHIRVECPACKKRLMAPERLAGKRAKCSCGAVLAVPAVAKQDEGALDALLAGERAGQTTCPSCDADMPPDAVLCTSCGYNVKTGKRVQPSLATDAGAPAGPPERFKPPKPTDPRKHEPRFSRDPWALLKWGFVLATLAGVGWIVWAMVSWVQFDPAQQARDLAKQIKPGMAIAEVVQLMGKAPREVILYEEKETGSGFLSGSILKPRKVKWREDFMTYYDEEDRALGIDFVYRFSERDHFNISFESDGTVREAAAVDIYAHLFGRD
ncbi:MAG TPA: hypothetical protein VMZ31_08840 [Phycisphaerae bacterium]|nr:hypothetical protein [Phycisphaerae bacterium]